MAYATKSRKAERYVNLNPSSSDYTQATLTMDNAYNDLDISAKIPAGAAGRLVHMRVGIKDGANNAIFIKRKGDNDTSAAGVGCDAGGGTSWGDVWVVCDDDRTIQYKVSSTADTITIFVRGHMLPGA